MISSVSLATGSWPLAHPRTTISLRLKWSGHADISVARDLLDTLAPPKQLLADKAYDADHLRDWLKTRRTQAVIPSTATRRTPYPLDKTAYKRRNLIERMFCRLKDWRRIATRYDRTARNFLSAIALAAILSFWAK